MNIPLTKKDFEQFLQNFENKYDLENLKKYLVDFDNEDIVIYAFFG